MALREPSVCLELIEHTTARFPPSLISDVQGVAILEQFRGLLDIQFPSPATQGMWTLTPLGWVGAINVAPNLTILSKPKIAIRSIARMLAEVYDLPVRAYPGLVECATIAGLYDQLARILASEALLLARQGLYHTYRPVTERRGAVRGRIVLREALRPNADPRLPCHYSTHTADVLENRVVLWTLDQAARRGLPSATTRQLVREARRRFLGAATLAPVTAPDVAHLEHNRLTSRYRRAHAVCRLLLESIAPVADPGSSPAIPFMLHMPSLFERFVSAWIGRTIGAPGDAYRLVTQERNMVGVRADLTFSIDLVIYDRRGRAVCVLDTKYKDSALPTADDVAQVGYYALLKGCNAAGLIYPADTRGEWEGASGPVRTFTLAFDLADDVDLAGAKFVGRLVERLREADSADRDRIRVA